MTCGDLLIHLLMISNPLQVDESEVRLAIDITAHELQRGHSLVLPRLDPASHSELVKLIEANPLLMAIIGGDGRIKIVRVE